MALPVDDDTLKNMRGLMVLMSTSCGGQNGELLPRSFGKLLEISPNVLAQRLIVVPDAYPYLKRPGTFTATVSKFTESGFLPGTSVLDCQTLPQTGLVNVCDNFYEQASGKACQQNPDSTKCEATGGVVPPASRRDDTCFLAIRGTNQRFISNWLVDATICLEPIPVDWGGGYCKDVVDRCRAHAGFTHAAETLMPYVVEAIRDYGCKELVVTGHSLGGSVALLMGFAIKNTQTDIRLAGAYTFEAPRVVDAVLAGAMEKSGYDVVRVTQGEDGVSLAPSYDFKGHRYKHVGREIFFLDLNGVRSTRTCASAACDADHTTCACLEGWRNRGVFPPFRFRTHGDFSKTSLDWNESSTCPWPSMLETHVEAVTPRRGADWLGAFSSVVSLLDTSPASVGYLFFAWAVVPRLVRVACTAIASTLVTRLIA